MNKSVAIKTVPFYYILHKKPVLSSSPSRINGLNSQPLKNINTKVHSHKATKILMWILLFKFEDNKKFSLTDQLHPLFPSLFAVQGVYFEAHLIAV